MSETDPLEAPVTVEPTVPIRVIREHVKEQIATIAHEREQARSMIEQGIQLQRQGDEGLKQLAGAEIALKKQLEQLDEYLKGAANA